MQYMQKILSWQQVSMKNDNFYEHTIVLKYTLHIVKGCLLFQITITLAIKITVIDYEIFYNHNCRNVQ